MDKDKWYDYFLDALSEKYPKKTELMQALMDLLCIEREAVYRRLRKDVAFHILEVVKISTEWNISLDRISGINVGKVPFQMQRMNYINPSDSEMRYLQNIIQSIYHLQTVPDTEFMDICNKLPRQLVAGFNNLNKFYLFKWMYQYHEDRSVPFSHIEVPDKKLQLTAEYYNAIKHVPNSNFIFDADIFDHLVNDITYFHSIQMVSSEEKECIKAELYELLDYLSQVASKGCYPETQNKVNMYVSQLNVDTNYSYVYTKEAKICFVHVFEKLAIQSFDPDMVTDFRTWMQLKKRMSTQISEVDEKRRIEFFVKQRQIIDSL